MNGVYTHTYDGQSVKDFHAQLQVFCVDRPDGEQDSQKRILSSRFQEAGRTNKSVVAAKAGYRWQGHIAHVARAWELPDRSPKSCGCRQHHLHPCWPLARSAVRHMSWNEFTELRQALFRG